MGKDFQHQNRKEKKKYPKLEQTLMGICSDSLSRPFVQKTTTKHQVRYNFFLPQHLHEFFLADSHFFYRRPLVVYYVLTNKQTKNTTTFGLCFEDCHYILQTTTERKRKKGLALSTV